MLGSASTKTGLYILSTPFFYLPICQFNFIRPGLSVLVKSVVVVEVRSSSSSSVATVEDRVHY